MPMLKRIPPDLLGSPFHDSQYAGSLKALIVREMMLDEPPMAFNMRSSRGLYLNWRTVYILSVKNPEPSVFKSNGFSQSIVLPSDIPDSLLKRFSCVSLGVQIETWVILFQRFDLKSCSGSLKSPPVGSQVISRVSPIS